jgi:hypothetical protein
LNCSSERRDVAVETVELLLGERRIRREGVDRRAGGWPVTVEYVSHAS